MKPFKTTDLYNKIIEIAKQNPDTCYTDRVREICDCTYDLSQWVDLCEYVIHDEPACIVGVAMYEMGASIDTIKDMSQYGDIASVMKYADIRGTGEKLFIMDGMEDEISNIQAAQDTGVQWGKAVLEAVT